MVFQRRKVASALAYMLGAGGAMALNAAPAQAADIRMDITGSSIRRVDAETALPVTVVTREDIARTGATNTEQLLQQAVSALSTMNATQLATGAGLSTYGQTSVSLRGLGSFRTLVLVNGRRLAPFAGDDGASVNVNSIPVAAIERIEVLRDGASAVYGSDAIAGVINFILTKDYTGVEVGGQYGAPTRSGGGDSYEVHAVAGVGTLGKDRYNVTLSANYTKDKVLWARDRDFAKTGNQFPYLVSGATGQGNIEGPYTPGTGSAANGTWVEGKPGTPFGTSPGSGLGNPLAATNNCEQINMFRNPTNTNKGAPFCAFDSAAFLNLLPEREAINGSVSFLFDITKDIQFFADGLYAKQKVTNAIQPSPVRRSFYQSDTLFQTLGIDPANIIYPSNPNYQIAANYLQAQGFGSVVGKPILVTGRVFDFGLRTTEDEATQWRAVAGLRGTWRNIDWEAAYTHNENKVEGKTTAGYFSQTAYARAIQLSNDYNPWSLQQSDAFNQSIASAIYNGATLNSIAKSDSVDGKITGDLMQLPAGPLAYALGAQWRKEAIDAQPSDALGTGDIAGLGGSVPPVNQNRKVTAVFGELNVPILKGLEGSVAVRYDDYSDFGGTTNYYLNLRYQPIKELLLRASYGTGFRAPTLLDLWQPITLGTSEEFTDPLTNQANLQVNAFSGGNPALKPETSKQWGLGFVIQPVAQFSFGLDWFSIKLDDIISTPGAQEVVTGFRNGDSSYANSVVLAAGGDIETISTQTVNAGTAKVEGFDVNLDYKDSFAWGRVGFNLQGTYISKFDQTSPGGILFHKVATLVDSNGDPVIGATDTGGVVLRWKHVATATYGYGPWTFSLTQNFYDGYETAPRQIDGERNFVKSQSIFDGQVSYTGIKNLRLAVGVKNMFDRDPPKYVPVANQFQAGYDVSLYDPRSRFVYGSINYKFF
jgi:iron complex outermembrane receptor protein